MVWDRNYGNSQDDFWIRHAIEEIDNTYGDRVRPKAKSLHKFGKNEDVGTSIETIWEQGGNETYVTTNAIDKISSSSGSDTEVITIEGHTVSGTGTDAEFTFVVQTVTLVGQTETALTTPIARVSRAYNAGSTALVGDVYIYEDDTVTAGVPQTATKIHLKIPAGQNTSFKGATTFSNTDYFILTEVHFAVGKKAAATVDFDLEVRKVGGLFLPKFQTTLATTGSNSESEVFMPYYIVPKNADVRIRAIASTTGVEADCNFEGILCEIAT
jgi:hypothetical protein